MNRREFLMSSACACLATATTKIDHVLAEDAPAPASPPLTIARRCGTPPPTPAAAIQARRVTSALRTYRVSFQGQTVVPVRWHIIHQGQRGKLPDSQINAQMDLLNKVYEPADLKFKTINVDFQEKPEWYALDVDTDALNDMKSALGKDSSHCLNIFTCEPAGSILGIATFPWDLKQEPTIDGVLIHNASLPNAPTPIPNWPFDLGMTAVHEIGHWCGLYHTFQDGCEAPGDDIEDTPFEANSAVGCPIDQPSSCPGEINFNPVDNYMDYSDDACMKHFTQQQIARVKDMVGYYRGGLNPTRRSALVDQIRDSIE